MIASISNNCFLKRSSLISLDSKSITIILMYVWREDDKIFPLTNQASVKALCSYLNSIT